MSEFLSRNLFTVVTAIVTLCGWVWSVASANARYEDSVRHLQKVEQEGSALAQHTRWKVDTLEKAQTKVEVRLDVATADIAQIKSDVRVIAEWVRSQKGPH